MNSDMAFILFLCIVPPVVVAIVIAINGRRINREWRERADARRAKRRLRDSDR